ncbi:MAG: hypothetical protein JWO38_824 [Gemmataceae bacterium]|nr:hypothetical protein [Gemmataceae bacterium]
MTTVASRAKSGAECPVCGTGSKGCSVTVDGLHMCRGEPGPGWKRVKQSGDFGCYRHETDRTNLNGTPRGVPKSTPVRDWPTEVAKHASNLTPQVKATLADELLLPVWALESVDGLGFTECGAKDGERWIPAWTFPLRTAGGTIVGISKRFPERVSINGGNPTNKAAAKDSREGVYLSRGWRECPGPTLLVEGGSNTIACAAAGVSAIGRFSNMVGPVEYLAALLKDLDPGRSVVVVGDRDERPDPKRPGETLWPGRAGAEKTATDLVARLGRPVLVAYPPVGFKDVRDWVIDLSGGQEAED